METFEEYPARFQVGGKLVDGNGNEVKEAKKAEEKPSGPFATFSKKVQKSLADAKVTTVAEAKTKGKEELMKLPDIGDATADEILALPDQEPPKED